MNPETILPILKWAAIISVSSAVIGGIVAGYLDFRRSNKQ